MCTKHNDLMELFCKTDQTCVCQVCSESDHDLHDVVSLKEEWQGKKAELRKSEAKFQQMIHEIHELRQTVKVSREAADRETAGGVEFSF